MQTPVNFFRPPRHEISIAPKTVVKNYVQCTVESFEKSDGDLP